MPFSILYTVHTTAGRGPETIDELIVKCEQNKAGKTAGSNRINRKTQNND